MTHLRRYIGRVCSICERKVWTSIVRDPFICATCRRSMAYTGQMYSSAAIIPVPVLSIGVCCQCHRDEQELSNGVCEDCRFYAIPEVDLELSEYGRRSNGGHNDWIKTNRTED